MGFFRNVTGNVKTGAPSGQTFICYHFLKHEFASSFCTHIIIKKYILPLVTLACPEGTPVWSQYMGYIAIYGYYSILLSTIHIAMYLFPLPNMDMERAKIAATVGLRIHICIFADYQDQVLK